MLVEPEIRRVAQENNEQDSLQQSQGLVPKCGPTVVHHVLVYLQSKWKSSCEVGLLPRFTLVGCAPDPTIESDLVDTTMLSSQMRKLHDWSLQHGDHPSISGRFLPAEI